MVNVSILHIGHYKITKCMYQRNGKLHTCICDELLPSNPGLEEDGGLGWLVGKCGGGNTCGILLPGLELVSIGGL